MRNNLQIHLESTKQGLTQLWCDKRKAQVVLEALLFNFGDPKQTQMCCMKARKSGKQT